MPRHEYAECMTLAWTGKVVGQSLGMRGWTKLNEINNASWEVSKDWCHSIRHQRSALKMNFEISMPNKFSCAITSLLRLNEFQLFWPSRGDWRLWKLAFPWRQGFNNFPNFKRKQNQSRNYLMKLISSIIHVSILHHFKILIFSNGLQPYAVALFDYVS